MAVCVLPGTELAFSNNVTHQWNGYFRTTTKTTNHRLAIFRQVNKGNLYAHHDALEFPDGEIIILTQLSEGQEAMVLQLPAPPTTTVETDAQKRVAPVA
jgi:hypothetical protein